MGPARPRRQMSISSQTPDVVAARPLTRYGWFRPAPGRALLYCAIACRELLNNRHHETKRPLDDGPALLAGRAHFWPRRRASHESTQARSSAPELQGGQSRRGEARPARACQKTVKRSTVFSRLEGRLERAPPIAPSASGARSDLLISRYAGRVRRHLRAPLEGRPMKFRAFLNHFQVHSSCFRVGQLEPKRAQLHDSLLSK